MQFQFKNQRLIIAGYLVCGFFSVQAFGQVENPVYCGPTLRNEKLKDTILEMIDEPAEFPGGYQALKKFFADHLVYSKEMIDGDFTGKYYVKFIVAKDGTCSNFTITKVLFDCPECDKEVLRVLRLMPKWKPGSVNGESVSSWYRLPIIFNPK